MIHLFGLVIGIVSIATIYMSIPSAYQVEEVRGTVQFPNNVQMPALIVRRIDNSQFLFFENEYNKQLINTFGRRGCQINVEGNDLQLRCNNLIGKFSTIDIRDNTYAEGGLKF